jgi:hypothetical protein
MQKDNLLFYKIVLKRLKELAFEGFLGVVFLLIASYVSLDILQILPI